MARTFTGTDKVQTSAFTIPTALSICWWEKNPTAFQSMLSFASILVNTYWRSDTGHIFLQRNFSISGDAFTDIAHTMTVSNWNHMAWTHTGVDADFPIFYANGSPITGSNWGASGTVNTTSSAFAIGNKTDGTSPSGTAAFVSMNNVVLAQDEVQAAMANGYAARGLVGYWPLNGQSPEPDLSGNGRSGTVTGTTVVDGPPNVPAATKIPYPDGPLPIMANGRI